MSLRLQTLIPLATTLFFIGCSGGGDSFPSSTPTTGTTVSFSGVAVDGYISGATACLDTNVNGKCDSGEPTTPTASDGTFSFTNVEVPSAKLVPVIVTSGTDTATNKPFTGELKSIVDTTAIVAGKSLSVSPLTDLSATLYINSSTKDAQALSTAKQKVATAYGLTADEVSLDPMKSSKVFAKAMEVQQTKALILATLPQSATMTQDESRKAVTQAISKQIDTSNSVTTTQVIDALETTLNIIVATNKKTFVEAQTQALKTTLDELAGKATTDNATLNSFQSGLEKVQAEAVTKVTNANDGTTITVVPVKSADTIIADNSTLATPPSVPTL